MPLNSSLNNRLAIVGFVVVTSMACSSTTAKIEPVETTKQFNQAVSTQSTITNREEPTAIAIFKSHSERVVSVVFSPDSQVIASASYDNTVKLWNPRTNQVIRTFSVKPTEKKYDKEYSFSIESSSKLSFSKDGKVLTLGNGRNALISWQVDTGRVVKKLRGRADSTVGTTFSSNGSLFANALSADIVFPSASDVENLSVDQLAQKLAQSDYSPNAGSIGIWDVRTGQQISTIPKTSLVFSMTFSSDDRFLASTDSKGEIHLWDLNSKKALRKWQGFRTVAISPNNKWIAGDSCKAVKVWNLKTGEEIYSLEQGEDSVEALIFSSDSKTLVTASAADNAIALWDLTTGKKIRTLSSPQVSSVAVSPNSELIASGNSDNTVRVWKLQ